MRNVCKHKKKIVYFILTTVIVVLLLHPDLNGRGSYDFIAREQIWESLRAETVKNISSTVIAECDYHKILFDETILPPSLIDGDLVEGHKIKDGGEFTPIECKPRFSSAIIIPYRDRAEELRGFLVYMHMFLRHQKINYRIYVIEQVDTKPFNRAKLLNVGAKMAMKAGFPCLILHDVDLLPLRPYNLYACTEYPRHMASSINKYRFVLPYLTIFDGVISILSSQYKNVNGMSNEFYGVGGDNDDFAMRLETMGLKTCRFDPKVSSYHMVSHKYGPKLEVIQKTLTEVRSNMLVDGLRSLDYTDVVTVLHPLFTHIMVDF